MNSGNGTTITRSTEHKVLKAMETEVDQTNEVKRFRSLKATKANDVKVEVKDGISKLIARKSSSLGDADKV